MGVYTDKRTGRLFVQFDYNKQTFKKYLPEGATRREAHKLETKLKAEKFFDAHGMIPKDAALFEDFVLEVYLPHVKTNNPANFYRADYICTAALPFFRGKTLKGIKPSDIEAFKSWRMSLPTQHGRVRMPATIAREMSIISKVFSLAFRDNIVDMNPCRRVDLPSFDNTQYKVLRDEDEERFFDSFDPINGQWAKEICKVVLHTGLRQNDVLGLTKFNIDMPNRMIVRLQGKTKRLVTSEMTPDVYEIIERRMQLKGSLLFPSPKGGGLARSVRTAIRGACIRAEIPILGMRDLRRTGASRLDDAGCGVSDIAGFLGHRDHRTAYRYIKGKEGKSRVAEILQNKSNPTHVLPMPKFKTAK